MGKEIMWTNQEICGKADYREKAGNAMHFCQER